MQLRNQAMRLRNNKSISRNLLELPSSRKRKSSSNLDDQTGVSRSSKNVVGVTKKRSGEYGVRCYDQLSEKLPWLGTFDNPEENDDHPDLDTQESSKKSDNTDCLPIPEEYTDHLDSDTQESSKKSDNIENKESTMEVDTVVLEDNSSSLEEKDDGPGSDDNQESSKKLDNIDSLPISEVNNDHPDSDNQESSKKSDNTDCSPKLDNQESSKKTDYLSQTGSASSIMGVSEKSLLIEKNGKPANKELIDVESSSVQSLVNYGRCPGARILLRTQSGTPVMNCHGILLGKWSYIDDLTLNFSY